MSDLTLVLVALVLRGMQVVEWSFERKPYRVMSVGLWVKSSALPHLYLSLICLKIAAALVIVI
jgi:hypothetical protein